VALVLASSLCPPPVRAITLAQQLQQLFDPVTQEVANSLARSYPLIAASAGVTYRFDPVTASFEREAAMAGQLFLEQADPIGRGRLNFNVSYQHTVLDTVEGHDTHDLRDPVPIALIDTSTHQVIGTLTFDHLRADAALHQTTLSVTYGITDDADVNLTLPIIVSDLVSAVNVSATNLVTGVTAHGGANVPELDAGAGDLILRGRYRFLDRDPVHAAAGLVLRFPSGSVQQLRGTGAYEVEPFLYLSTRQWQPATWARLAAHLNAGLDLVADDVSTSEGRWGVGADWGISEGATVGIAVLGRHAFSRLEPEGFFDLVRVLPGPRLGVRPLFGLTGARPDYYDFSLGGRVNVWRDRVIAFANAVFPLNSAGVRTEIIPLVGVEFPF
jgi:hypothetical protein